MHYNKIFKLIICAISTLFLVACASNEITQTKAETTVELGSECNITPTDYFELGSKVNPETIAVDTSSVDTNTVGEYVAVVTYNDNTYEIKVSVSDTIVPEIVVKPDIEGVDRGTTIHPADYVEVNDLSEVEVYFVAEDGDVSSLEIPSDLDDSVTEINYTVVAVDASGNRSEELIVTVDMNSTDIDPAAQDADSTFIESASTSEETKEETNSENPFMGMTREELEKVDCSNFSDKELDDYLEAYQSTEPKHGTKPWTGKPFEEMTQDELNEIDDETWDSLTKEDQQRWLDRYDETIAEKAAAETQQNQNSDNTAPAEEHWEVEIELGPIEPSDIKCY